MTLFDAASKVEDPVGYLEDDLLALELLYEGLESEGWQHPDKPIDEYKAESFVRRFPRFHARFHASFRIILAELQQRVQELRSIDDELYKASRKEKEAAKK